MKTLKTPLIYTGLLVFAAAAIVGWKTGTSNAPAESPEPSGNMSTRHSGSSTSPDLLGNVRSQRTEGDRMRTAIEMARTLPSSEIREWLDQGKFNLRSGYAMTLFQKIAFERWAKEEPSEFLIWAGSHSSSDYKHLIADIVKNQPGAIQNALAAIDSHQKRDVVIQLISTEAPDLALSELRKLLASPDSANHNFYSAINALIEHRPDELERMLDETTGPSRDTLEQVVFSAKLKKDFAGTLTQLYELPNGFDYVLGRYSYNNSRFLKPGELLSHLADFPESWRAKAINNSYQLFNGLDSVEQFSAVDWAGIGFTPEQTGKIQSHYFQQKIQNKPDEALAAMGDYSFSEKEKRRILNAAFYRNRTEEDLTRFRNHLSTPGNLAIFDEIAKDKMDSILLKSNQAEIKTPAQLVDSLADRSISDFSNVIRNWNPEQKADLLSTYHNLEGPDKDYFASVASKQDSQVSSELRNEALKHLLTLPDSSEFADWKGRDNSTAIDTVSQNALTLMQTDPASATRWLAGLPDSSIRLQAQKNLAINWQNYEPEAVKTWISTLPATEQTEINSFLKAKKR